ncbi:hypothetical protein ACFQS7_04680 [Dankookia sp. GCM10030260]|uniref:hypothetical protein n=1 Tax=Dankookia sp. GCM10030260 TaxID=3273390 RepID=UPI00360F55BE
MPASQARAARPGWRRAAAVALILLLPTLAAAQNAPRAGAGARPGNGAAGGPGLAPLQTEPGDIWAEVRGWDKGTGAQAKPEPARRKPAARTESAEGQAGAAPTKPRRAAPCAPDAPGCTARPARQAANPG